MTADLPDNALELRSLVTSHGMLELSLQKVPIPVPSANEVLVRVEASPINPSDLGLLLAGADMTTAHVSGTPECPVITASLTEDTLRALSGRVDRSLPVGNEGSGTVVAAGPSSTAQALLGKTVAIAGGSMYAQYRAVDAAACLVLPEGITAREGASSFVNPLTALRRSSRPRTHGCRVESWPDARQALR
jgi:NADPH:quinone reductase